MSKTFLIRSPQVLANKLNLTDHSIFRLPVMPHEFPLGPVEVLNHTLDTQFIQSFLKCDTKLGMVNDQAQRCIFIHICVWMTITQPSGRGIL